jgi:hypothetical protein
MEIEVSPLDPFAAPSLDEAAGPARILPLSTIAQTTLVEVNHRAVAHPIT